MFQAEIVSIPVRPGGSPDTTVLFNNANADRSQSQSGRGVVLTPHNGWTCSGCGGSQSQSGRGVVLTCWFPPVMIQTPASQSQSGRGVVLTRKANLPAMVFGSQSQSGRGVVLTTPKPL